MFLTRIFDIIAVPGNPLENIRVLEDLRFVMNGGEIHCLSSVEARR